MEIRKTKNLSDSQFQQINKLWNTEYPVQLKNRFGLLLNGVENYNHYLIEENSTIIAWAVYFEKDNEIRFSIIVNSTQQGKGLGKALISQLKNDLGEFYAWVIDHDDYKKENGEVYHSPLLFYTKNGFEILQHTRTNTDLLKAVKIRRVS